MSIHRSLLIKAALKRSRNVLKREERLNLLEVEEKWKEGDSIFGLPKVKGEKKLKKIKVPKEPKTEAEAEAEAEAKEEDTAKA